MPRSNRERAPTLAMLRREARRSGGGHVGVCDDGFSIVMTNGETDESVYVAHADKNVRRRALLAALQSLPTKGGK